MDYPIYIQCKKEYENIIKIKTNGILVRSKAQWHEEGEKNTKYFLNLEKRNYNKKYIKRLINDNNEEITDPKLILEEEKLFYKKLYSSKLKKSETDKYQESCMYFLYDQDIPKLSQADKDAIETELSIPEIAKALNDLPNNKSPGPDGLTTNFYKCFWPDLKDLIYQSFIYSFEIGKLSQDQRYGILNLIPKDGKDIRYLSNWRPISLLNTDYKILTKTLAKRLHTILPNIIHSDQVGYLKSRYIGENIRIISDLISYANLEHSESYITQVEKAFDSIE